MSETTPQNRRLAAVMFLDMVGFSAMMSRNETRALEHIRQLEKVVRAIIPSHGGRVVKFLGDGTLAEFPTAVSAVLCGKAILENVQGPESLEKAPDLKVRIGLHLGELLEHDNDIFGDAVNIAARVQPLADPNSIAMSDAVYAQVKNQMSLQGDFLPPQKLKNIPGRQKIFVVAPTERSFQVWRLQRRFLPAAAGFLLLAAAGAGAVLLLRSRETVSATRTALVLAIAKEDDAESVRLARAIEEEMEIAGPKLKGLLWMSRNGVWETLHNHGIVDATAVTRGEAGACRISREIGLRFPMIARLERHGAAWRLETRSTDTEDLSVVGVFTAEGRTPEELADQTVRQIQDWWNENGETF